MDPTLIRALRLLHKRGRAYNTGRNGQYVSVKVFSVTSHPLRDLVAAFGGSVYTHPGGWIWVLSEDGALATMAILLSENAGGKVRARLGALFDRYGVVGIEDGALAAA